MFLLRSIDLVALVALVALFIQTFVAWVFVALFATLRHRDPEARASRDQLLAFTSLAVALSAVSLRLLQGQELLPDVPRWTDGEVQVDLCYSVYLVGKVLFCYWLLRAACALAGRTPPAWSSRAAPGVALLMALVPPLVADIHGLIILQAPLMMATAVAGLVVLRNAAETGDRQPLIRGGFIGLGVSWLLHALAAMLFHRYEPARIFLSANSLTDLVVQLMLGIGLSVGTLQAAHRRARAAEAARAELQRIHDRDGKLRALGTLVSGVAHELNNPLTVILGYCDLLDPSDDPESPARIVREQAERCRGIVRDLSVVASASPRRRESLDAREVVQRVIRGIAATHLRPARRIEQDVPEGLDFAADRSGVEQVLANLLVNALQVSPPSGVVAIEARRNAARGVTIAVTDQGPGVPAELRERLFEPFFTTKGPGEGTGLGLAIARAIVHAHGGTIEVLDAPNGRGARFAVHFPAADAGPVADRTPADGGGRQLLVIDDDPGVRSVIARQAARRGWRTVEAASAEEALRIAEGSAANVFHAIVCDIRMPGIGGAGFHDRVVRDAPELLSRTLFVTGDLASPEAVQFVERCRRPIVRKPFDYDELFVTVDACAVPAS
jgi:signal transduction histidine kinase/ActR/RegA family two-component response regulator